MQPAAKVYAESMYASLPFEVTTYAHLWTSNSYLALASCLLADVMLGSDGVLGAY